MRLKLPKALLKYIQPRDREHEARLAILWGGFRRYLRDYDDEQDLAEMERAMLGEVFQIPEEQWHQFMPKKSAVSYAEGMRAALWLAERLKMKQGKKRPHKPKKLKTPIVILRKTSPPAGSSQE